MQVIGHHRSLNAIGVRRTALTALIPISLCFSGFVVGVALDIVDDRYYRKEH